ncbi:hypothetical protein COT75_03795 [Candidatus Beckwithbacteria bacterium CG10_big_fil_rev_8_21_14_0_10_34_10]|uniref:HTH luxR-type domain-containing protein n=1 Tax=Candidatus Beckwithbacteria bacterium CG10_big_fil_rev_8_21_14_0_10_34_10 TaxID=1974495 RepID=A0A2H0W8G6_9BACT|nr:MAG: hypothetical protein COT75_03795 [Candidatus Beckwithbacteria bacterium CG10_big_fil_rev_8_21_14_0_10_34_10]
MEKIPQLVPINPFTPRQREVIECILKGLTSYEKIASDLGISYKTVENHFLGTTEGEIEEHSPDRSLTLRNRAGIGIFGIVEELNRRPGDMADLVSLLMDDVVFFESEDKIILSNSGLLLEESL